MADYSFGYGGIGSGLDISAIVSQLVAAERAPQDSRLNKLEAAAKFKLSGLGSISSAFDKLKTALDSLQKPDAFGARKLTVVPGGGSDTPALAATAGRGTPVGRYQIEVLELASAHKLVSGGMAAGTGLGAGSLQLEIGGESMEIVVEAGATLADLRSAINAAAAGHEIQAALLTSDQGHHLSIGSSRAGAEHAISISVNEGGDDLRALVDSLQERAPAADARVTIDGLPTTASGNTIADAVPGLTLELLQTGTSTVEVSADPAGSRAALQEFVNAYNGALAAIRNATAYNADTGTPSSLTGDAQARGAASQLRSVMGGLLAELAAQGLDAGTLGLQTRGFPDADGSLVLDATVFDAAMRDNAGAIVAAFTGPDGLAARLGATVGGYVGSDGAFTARTAGFNDQIKQVANRRDALDARMENVARRYQAQFVALDTLMAQMSTTSNFLAQQLNMLTMQAQAR